MKLPAIRQTFEVTRQSARLLSHVLCRNMSDEERPDHVTRTAHNTRTQFSSKAVVTKMRELSPTVMGLTLQVDNKFSFKAGQWVDFHIPNIETVGGYSMCSCPSLLHQAHQIGLAVKFSKHPPAHWVQTQCRAGSEVTVVVGGDFFYDPQPDDPPHDLILIAGGVGINPMLSMAMHAADLMNQKAKGQHVFTPGNVLLLFTAGCKEELIFKEEIEGLCEKHHNLHCWNYVTREEINPDDSTIKGSRITCEEVDRAIETLSSCPDSVQAYVCGPSPMIDSMESYLLKAQVPKSQLHYEKWW